MTISKIISTKNSLYNLPIRDPIQDLIFSHMLSFFLINDLNQSRMKDLLQPILQKLPTYTPRNTWKIRSILEDIESANYDDIVFLYLEFIYLVVDLESQKYVLYKDIHSRPVIDNQVTAVMTAPWLDVLLRCMCEQRLIYTSLTTHCLITHDIDKISYVEQISSLFRSVAGDLIKRRMFYPARLLHYFTKRNVHRNLNNLLTNFDHIFLFLPSTGVHDADYLPSEITSLIKVNSLENIGFHYSYHCLSFDELSKEYEYVKPYDVHFCRGHYLRSFETQRSFIGLNKMIDLTAYNLSVGGFPLFTSYPILLGGKNTRRVSLATTCMDTTFEIETPMSDCDAINSVRQLFSLVKQNGGIFCLNWHNTSIYWGNWPRRRFNYQNVIRILND